MASLAHLISPPLPHPNALNRAGKAKRRAADTLGRRAEDEVAARLRNAGFQVLAVRLKTPSGEIDLVAADARRLIFVEVKARPSFTEAAYAVSPRQQARLLQAASVALALNQLWARPETQFDVALVTAAGIKFIEDAIRAH